MPAPSSEALADAKLLYLTALALRKNCTHISRHAVHALADAKYNARRA